jgi:hypothetical protein
MSVGEATTSNCEELFSSTCDMSESNAQSNRRRFSWPKEKRFARLRESNGLSKSTEETSRNQGNITLRDSAPQWALSVRLPRTDPLRHLRVRENHTRVALQSRNVTLGEFSGALRRN